MLTKAVSTILGTERNDQGSRSAIADDNGKSRCRFCGTPLEHTFVDLGMSPLANSYLRAEDLRKMEPFYPLQGRDPRTDVVYPNMGGAVRCPDSGNAGHRLGDRCHETDQISFPGSSGKCWNSEESHMIRISEALIESVLSRKFADKVELASGGSSRLWPSTRRGVNLRCACGRSGRFF